MYKGEKALNGVDGVANELGSSEKKRAEQTGKSRTNKN